MTGFKRVPICRTLGIGRSTAYRDLAPRGRRYRRAGDRLITPRIRAVIKPVRLVWLPARDRARQSRRRTALQSETCAAGDGAQRLDAAAAEHADHGRAHAGWVQRARSNERWSSDLLAIVCWNGAVVELAFALDCADREWLAWVAAARDLRGADIRALMTKAITARFGAESPPAPVEWLSDNESMYTALDTVCAAERLGLLPITTPAYSPQSNGLSEALVNTLRRDYLAGTGLSSAATVIAQIAAWQVDYNGVAPHSALGYRSPLEYRAQCAGEVI